MKTRRFAEGGEPTYGEDERPAPTGMSEAAQLMPERQKSFKEAFAEARAAGDRTFMWKGKKFSTEMAGSSGASSAPLAGRPRGETAASSAPEPQRVEITGKRYPRDDQSKSVSERLKSARERARTGSGETDTRSVSERLRSSLGFAKGGSVRGGGCEQRGKTRGKFV